MKLKSLLIVCIGNICRSPIAEELFKISLKDTNINILSSGIEAVVGAKAHEHSIEVMKENGYILDSHIARQINLELALSAELILVMSNHQKKELEKKYPAICGKVMRVGHWNNKDISDPMGKDIEEFKKTYKLIKESVDLWVEKLL